MSVHKANEIISDNEMFSNRKSLSKIIEEDPDYVDKTADWIITELGGGTGSREYFCKVAMNIRRPFLDNLVVTAKEKGDDPVKLFNYLTKRQLIKIERDKR